MPVLKNAARAIIDPRKLTDYLLNPHNERGMHKARIFQATLGWLYEAEPGSASL